jgi:membrane protein
MRIAEPTLTWNLAQLIERIERTIWNPSLEGLPFWKASGLRLARFLLVARARCAIGRAHAARAMSLVYTTLLSLAPLLALSFSVLKAFGVHNQIEPMLNRFLAPLGDKRDEVTHRIIGFIENLNVGVLGAVGLVLLLYTVVSLIQKIESSFNHIWHVRQPRSIGARFSNYLSVLLIGPILVFSAMAVTAGIATNSLWLHVLSVQPVSELAAWMGRCTPYLLVIGAFTFILHLRAEYARALRPGVDTAASSAVCCGNRPACCSPSSWPPPRRTRRSIRSFAILVLFMIWLYLNWLILLIGASVAFYLAASGVSGRGQRRARAQHARA